MLQEELLPNTLGSMQPYFGRECGNICSSQFCCWSFGDYSSASIREGQIVKDDRMGLSVYLAGELEIWSCLLIVLAPPSRRVALQNGNKRNRRAFE